MATIVHRASSAMYDHPSSPIIPQRRRREPSIEIIDVDQLDEGEYMPRPPSTSLPHPPSQRRRILDAPEEIIVLDSDDEEYDPSVLGTNSTESQSSSSQVHSREISPAPFARARRSILPRMPGRRHSSIPMRRLPPSFPSSSAPVVANPLVSDYERFLQFNVPSSTPHASSSRSRHEAVTSSSIGSSVDSSFSNAGLGSQSQPNPRAIRAGGGLITLARAHAAERRAERERLAQLRAAGAARPRIRSRRPGPTPADNMHFVGRFRYDSFNPFDSLEGLDFLGFNGLVRYGPGFVHPTVQTKSDEPDYRPEFTHPKTAGPGFCFDFDTASSQPSEQSQSIDSSVLQPEQVSISSQDNPIVLDDDGEIIHEFESKPADVRRSGSIDLIAPSPVSISLVCSKCLDPLLLGEGASANALKMAAAGASVEQVENERKARRVWGLRCGHLIDGKCLEALGYPIGALDAQKMDIKGKGKGVSEEADIADATDGESESKKIEAEVSLPESNSIRSRLRSATHHQNGSTSGPSSSDNSNYIVGAPVRSLGASIARLPTHIAHLLGDTGPPSSIAHLFDSTSRGSSSTISKSKSKQPRKSKTQETFTWNCPVSRCGKVHTSVKVDGLWGPEKVKGEGAISLFI